MLGRMAKIDRLAPARRPAQPVWGLQRWRQLLFMHWAVPFEALRRAVPPGLELDLHDGVAYVGVVPFAMQAVRPKLVPGVCGASFESVNRR